MFGLSSLYMKLIGAGVLVALALGLWGVWTWRGHELAVVKAQAAAEAVQITNLQAQAKHASQVQAISDLAGTKAATAQAAIQANTNSLLPKVQRYATAQDDALCHVSRGLVGVLNAAAGVPDHAVPAPAGQSDDAASGVALSDVARNAVLNDGIAKQNAAQLSALQGWIVSQEAIAPESK